MPGAPAGVVKEDVLTLAKGGESSFGRTSNLKANLVLVTPTQHSRNVLMGK